MDVVFKLHCPVSLERGGASGFQLSQAQNVVVLAQNFELSKAQFDLLSRGLSFIPTVDLGRDQKLQWEADLQHYHRKVKLAAYYKDSPGKEKLPFIGPSSWTPPLDMLPPQIKILIHSDLEDFKSHYKFVKEQLNISLDEVKVLQELKTKKNIVIKPADKGSAVVILSREQYLMEVERQLNNSVYYRKLDGPMYLSTIPMVAKILDSLKRKKFINAKQRQYLSGSGQPRERRFYILPKIHKDPKTWTVPFEVPPGRPIVSDCESETYFTAEYLDHYLNPISVRHPAFVKDTYHFIEIVKSLRIPSEFYFFSMDVDNLYTNIPIEAGVNCVEKVFKKYPDPKRPDEELIELLKINLTRNDFMFNDKFYLQVKGTAMGKKFAPAYANIFMANWEDEALSKCKKKPACYLRYLDDIWGIWTGSREEFREFVDVLNSHDSSIKLKTEISEASIDFLDTTVFKGPDFSKNNKLDVKVYFKSTDTHALLHRDSFHPTHTFRGIVKSQLLRFKRICTRREDFWGAVKVLFKALRGRGYSRNFLRSCLKTFEAKKQKNSEERIPLITTFSSVGQILNWKCKNNFENVLGREELISCTGTISAYRRNRNLRDWLVRAKLPSLDWKKPQRKQSYFSQLRFIRSNKESALHRIQQGFDLKSKNIVYLIFCSKCQAKYVGETRNELSLRLFQHMHNIRNRKDVDTPLVKHFLDHGLPFLRIAGLERNVNWTDWERKKRERLWIFMLGTREPLGLNLKRN